ncbi:MAG TPA: hypothetical protein PLL88_04320 [Anaerolineaceae bacterium]|nr:hypothetical protein [Anaerolineaceae bacterium]
MHKKGFHIILFTILMLACACGSKPEADSAKKPTDKPSIVLDATAPTEKEKPPTDLMPGEPNPQAERTLEDADASLRAYERRVVSGDNILDNLYERPFTSQVMDYQPDLNILTAAIVSDDAFIYFTITLASVDPVSGILNGTYGIEFDRTQSGRGDLLVLVSQPGTEWSMKELVAYTDTTGSVGGARPIVAEAGYPVDGYTEIVELGGDKVAWARMAPEDTYAVQIAVSRALLGTEEFLWGAWADGEVKDPSLFDYNDHFAPVVAGSPIKTDTDYPLKELASLDNTCRLPFKLENVRGIPGMCTSIPAASSGSSCVCVRWSSPLIALVCLEWDCD